MAHLGEDFNPDAVEPRDSLEPVPAGTYMAEIVESDVVDTKGGTGRMVKLTWKITEGACEGRRIWDQINFRNANETAQKIGQQALAELCSAAGLRGPLDDTESLHGIPMRVRVKIETDKNGQYPPKNVVQRYAPYADGEAPATTRQAPAQQSQSRPAPAASAATPARAAAGAMPWKRP